MDEVDSPGGGSDDDDPFARKSELQRLMAGCSKAALETTADCEAKVSENCNVVQQLVRDSADNSGKAIRDSTKQLQDLLFVTMGKLDDAMQRRCAATEKDVDDLRTQVQELRARMEKSATSTTALAHSLDAAELARPSEVAIDDGHLRRAGRPNSVRIRAQRGPR